MGQEELEISEPIVPLLETIVPDTQSAYAKILVSHLTVRQAYYLSLLVVLGMQSQVIQYAIEDKSCPIT
jgi:hypothetical protein